MSVNRTLITVGSILLPATAVVSVACSVSYATDEGNRYVPLVVITAASLAVTGVFAGVLARWSRSATSIVVLLLAAVAVHAHAILTSDALGIVGQSTIGYLGVAAGLTLFVGVALERIDGRAVTSRAPTSD